MLVKNLNFTLYFCRCGMVYLDPEELKWIPYVKTWMATKAKKFKEETKEYLMDLFVRYVEDGFKFITKKCTQTMPQVSLEYIKDHSIL